MASIINISNTPQILSEEQEEKVDYDQELLNFLRPHIESWRDYRNANYMTKYERWERVWRGIWSDEDKTRQSERSKVITPVTQQAIETRHAEIMEAIFGQGEFFDIKDNIEDENQNPVDIADMKAKLKEDYATDKIRKSIDQIGLLGEIYGTGIGEIIVTAEDSYTPAMKPIDGGLMAYGINEGSRVSVKLNPVNPKNFLHDPNGVSIDDCMGVAIEKYVSTHAIVQGMRSGVYRDVDITSFYKDDSGEPAIEQSNFRNDKVLLLTYYGLVPREYLDGTEEPEEYENGEKEHYSDMVEAIVVLANDDIVLKAIESPYMMKDRPVILYQADTVPNKLLGRGTAEKSENMQSAVDAMVRSHIDSMALTSAPMMGIDASRIPRGAKYQVKPGANFLTNGNPAEILYPFKFGQTDSSLMETSREFERMALMATGTMDTQGMISAQNREGVNPAITSIIKKYKRVLVNFQEDFLIPFIKKSAWRYMQFDPERYPAVDVTFVPTSTLGIIAREHEQKQLAFLMQTLGDKSPLTPILMQGILENSSLSNREKMMAQIAEASKPDPQMQQMQAQKAQAEMQVLQAQVQELSAKAQKLSVEAQVAPVLANQEVNKVKEQIVLERVKAENNLNQEQVRSQNDVAIEQAKMEAEKQVEIYKAQLDEQRKADELAFEKYKADLQAQVQIYIAELKVDKNQENMNAKAIIDSLECMNKAMEKMNKPKKIVRDEDGNLIGVE